MEVSSVDKDNLFDKIGYDLDENGGVMTITMSELINAIGAKKLGRFVAEDIHNQLEKRGIGSYYFEKSECPLPISQAAVVRLYRKGSKVANLIDAVRNIRSEEFMKENKDNDKKIVDTASNEHKAILDQIKHLVCY